MIFIYDGNKMKKRFNKDFFHIFFEEYPLKKV